MATKTDIEEQFSRDAVFNGRLIVHQPVKGYRFSIDALLLIYFASQGRKVTRAIDLGAGSGIVGLGLLAGNVAERVVGVELQHNLAELAKKNSKINGFEERYELLKSNICNLKSSDYKNKFDLVVANPPFWPSFDHRMPIHEERRLACHEVMCGLEEWTKAAKRLMNQKKGRFVAVFPSRRLDCLVVAMERASLSATRMRLVHPNSRGEAELLLVEARVGKTGRVTIESPLVLKNEKGEDTFEALSIISGSFSNEIKRLPDMR